MKTMKFLACLCFGMSVLILNSGCEKETLDNPIQLGVQFENTNGNQKVYVDGKKMWWNDGDRVLVNGLECNVNATSGEITANENENGYAAVYSPAGGASLNGSGKTSTGGAYRIPTMQSYVLDASNHQIIQAPMAALLDTKFGNLCFRNLFSLVKVTVANPRKDRAFTIKKIRVESPTGNLSGEYNFAFTGVTSANAPTCSEKSGGTMADSVVMNFPNGIVLAANASEYTTQDFYLVVAPFTNYDLKVLVVGNTGQGVDSTYLKVGKAKYSLNRNQVGKMAMDLWKVYQNTDDIGTLLYGRNFFIEWKTQGNYAEVAISPGNLQYQASTNTFRFPEHQYDYIGNTPGNSVATGRSTQSAWIDLFPQASSGYDADAKPWAIGLSRDIYKNLLTKGTGYNNQNLDWGVYNDIYNYDGTLNAAKGTWVTMQENYGWQSLINSTTRPGGTFIFSDGSKVEHIHWFKGSIALTGGNTVYGLFMLPDSSLVRGMTSFSTIADHQQSVNITAFEWDLLEHSGCIFLPFGGMTQTTTNSVTVVNVNMNGTYWTCTVHDQSMQHIYGAQFDAVTNTFDFQYKTTDLCSVRPVKVIRDNLDATGHPKN